MNFVSIQTPRHANKEGVPFAVLKGCYNLIVVGDDERSKKSVRARLEADLVVTPNEDKDYGGARQQPVRFYETTAATGHVVHHVPRTYGLAAFGSAGQGKTVRGDAFHAPFDFHGTLRTYQAKACQRVLAEFSKGDGYDAVLQAGVGCGKTIMALYLASRWKRATAIFVHKGFLLKQWTDRIHQFLPGARVGAVQGNTFDVDGKDFVVCMIQTLVRRTYDPSFYDRFGLVVVDEVHHICAQTFQRSLRPFPAAHRLGLSATPFRKDGLTKCIHWLVGPTVCTVTRTPGTESQGSTTLCPTVRWLDHRPDGWRTHTGWNGKLMYPKMITQLCDDADRTCRISMAVATLATDENRRILVVSERRKHLVALAKELSRIAPAVTHSFYCGETTKTKKRKRNEDALVSTVLFSTTSMCEEGLDLPFLDTLCLASPKGGDQIVGRILRQHEGKQRPLIVDVRDHASIFYGMARKRAGAYAAKGYVQSNLPRSLGSATSN